jgi:hypothetical protein
MLADSRSSVRRASLPHRDEATRLKSSRIINDSAWAVGEAKPTGFHVRKVVWGRLMAQYERREGEVYQRVRISPYAVPGDRPNREEPIK